MTYADEAALARDPSYAGRVQACLCSEAQIKGDPFSQNVLRDPVKATEMFMPFVSTAPGFGDAFADGGQASVEDSMLLSAVQACWDAVVEINSAPDTWS